tara:strand:- start:3794 stop:5608 length:1815 start_codon:yes stop_codon:yes gene_type:complete
MAETTLERNKQVRDINYLARDFNSYKNELINYTKKYFPNDWQDFNEASGGMALLEMIAYVSDNLSFLIDRSVNECFIDRAIEPKNIYSLAKNMGYSPKFKSPSLASLEISATFDNSTSSQSVFTLSKGSRVRTSIQPSVNFEIVDDVDFSSSRNRTSSTPQSGFTTFTVSGVNAISGISKTFETTVGVATPFLRVELPDSDINEIFSVESSDGKEWYKVNNLAEETIFYGDLNTDNATKDDTPYILKLKKVPRRFTVEKSAGNKTSLIFGGGTSSAEDSEIIPNPEDFVLPPSLRGSPSGFSPSLVDSSNFLKTGTLGIAPSNTIISINYRVGGGIQSNVGRNTISEYATKIVEFANPDIVNTNPSLSRTVTNTLTVTNTEQATGGAESEDLRSIKRNAISAFSAQNRVITLQDYQVRVLSMPANFGSVFRCFARKDPKSNTGVELILSSVNSQNNLVASNGVLKNNVETYIKQFKSFSDTIKISDAKIVNLGVEFGIEPAVGINGSQALLDALLLLKDLLRINNTSFNDEIIISEYVLRIQSLSTVNAVSYFRFVNLNKNNGTEYSDYIYDVKSNTSNGKLKIPADSLWEIKFPDRDIVGAIG